MPQFRFPPGRFLTALLALACLFANANFASAQKSDAQPASDKSAEPKAADEAPQENTELSETDKAFVVPEGNDPETLQEFLNGLREAPVAEETRAGYRDHLGKIHDAAQEVLKRDAGEETSGLAIDFISDSLALMERYGDRSAPERKAAFVEELKQSPRPALATRGRLLAVEGQISETDPEDPASIKSLIDQVAQTLKDKPLTIQHGRLAYTVVTVLEQLGDPKLVDMAVKAFAPPLKASDEEILTELAETMEGTARRLNLKGNSMQLAGTTMAGEEFNLDQWKGKVVIVDFWATWCGPCVAELPNLKALYEKRHDDGLEIVGISLDESRTELKEFLKRREIPWPTLFVDPQGKEAWDNPVATHYGVAQLPTVFLIGRDGKVVSTELFGAELTEAVNSLLDAE